MNFKKAEEFIKQFEGLSLVAYQKTYNGKQDLVTIGYGHTGHDVILGMTITQNQADDILEHDIKLRYALLLHYLPIDIIQNENQLTAILSLVFNIGVGNFSTSTMLKKIREKESKEEIANEFPRWNKENGIVIEGLIRRRQTEMQLFLS